ncbi:DUF6527 family protein [Bradyrhizobium sp. CCBAU 45384]|uniref:DUF6527 family protein n=1 Tax=Bradyrhizobium sp. CCBAU 45384 TaxID=858428 RepID=UPI003FA486E4
MNALLRTILLLLVWLGLVKRPRYQARFAEQHPSASELADNDLVVVQSGGFTKWACFKCPCGCGQKIALSLQKDRRPSWSVVVDWLQRPTVAPSINQPAGCRSHFWIKRGDVEWAGGP